MHEIIRKAARFIFSFHRNNKGKDYIQGWYCLPKRSRWPRLRRLCESLCGILTGHEVSNTEWGYGGGSHVDGNCRWCDKRMPIPLEEARFRWAMFNDVALDMDFEADNDPLDPK